MCFLISITLSDTYAQTQRGKKEDAKAEEISFKDRWGFKTNAVDWLLTVPNIGVEFDLGNTIRNKHTIGANVKWNWNTSQKYTPSIIFNMFDARVEWRQYFRTRQRGGVTKDAGLYTRMKERVFTTRRKNPRAWRAYYWGAYVNASTYSFKLGKQGIQGDAYGAGISLGYTAPLYGYRNNYIDLELGGAVGLLYTKYDVFEHDAESGCYPRIADKCKGGHLVPFPMITDVRVAFVYRFVSVKDKYKQSITRRADIRSEKRNALNAKINKLRERIDSISTAARKQGLNSPDSLLNKEELKEWRKMQKETLQKNEEEAAKKLKRHIADSLGIQLSDTVPLTKAQQKALRNAEKAYKEAQEKQESAQKKQKNEARKEKGKARKDKDQPEDGKGLLEGGKGQLEEAKGQLEEAKGQLEDNRSEDGKKDGKKKEKSKDKSKNKKDKKDNKDKKAKDKKAGQAKEEEKS